MTKETQNSLVDKFNSALSEYRKGRLSIAYEKLIQINRDKVYTDEKDIFEQSEVLISKIKKVRGLRRSRYVLIITTIVIFISLLLGLSVKVNDAFVTINVQANRINFKLGEDLVSNPMKISDIDLVGINDLSISVKSIKMATYDSSDHIRWVSLLDHEEDINIKRLDAQWSVLIQSYYVVLEYLKIQDGSNVTFEKLENNENQFSIIVDKGKTNGSIDTDQIIQLSCNSCELVYKNKVVPIDGIPLQLELINRQIRFEKLQHSILKLSIEKNNTPTNQGQFHTGDNILIHSIDFEKYRNGKPVSSIKGESMLNFNDFQNRNYSILSNEYLFLDRLRNFQLVEFDILNDFEVRAIGYAGYVNSGSELSLKNRMPNYIEWLIENEKIKIIIALLFPILSVVTAMLYRLKIIDES